VFALRFSRGSKVAKELIGENYKGIVISDRWSGYTWLPLKRRQLCWAHLKRDFQKIVEVGGEVGAIGEGLQAQRKKLFDHWHRVRDGTLKRSTFRSYVSPIRAEVKALLRQGKVCDHAKTAGMCKAILKAEQAMWTFVRVEGIEPTNNDAERALRHAVIWRKTSFGTQSDAGSEFVEGVLTAVGTLRAQGRNVLDYLTETCSNALHGTPAPSLLPHGGELNVAGSDGVAGVAA
jgi:transposase